MNEKDSLTLVFAALADPTRRDILTRLSAKAMTVGEVAEPFEMSAPAISQHLRVLEGAGLIERNTKAQWRVLSVRVESLEQAAEWVEAHRRDWNERLDRLADHLENMKGSDDS